MASPYNRSIAPCSLSHSLSLSMAPYSTILGIFLSSLILSSSCWYGATMQDPSKALTLDTVRVFLTRLEDSIVFCLIERARYPLNSPAYDPSYLGYYGNRSIAELVIRGTEAIQAKAGKYQNPEEIPFFPDDLPRSMVPPYNYTQVLYPAAASVNVSNMIWNMYFNSLLPLFTSKEEDGNYGSTAASDLVCLQTLSTRIHYGRFVAEVKFSDAPQDYIPSIQAQDKNVLNNLVTSESQEEVVVKRVEKKAMVFGQNVTLETQVDRVDNSSQTNYKVDPLVAGRLYKEWVIPLTKLVEVEYLLRRLD